MKMLRLLALMLLLVACYGAVRWFTQPGAAVVAVPDDSPDGTVPGTDEELRLSLSGVSPDSLAQAKELFLAEDLRVARSALEVALPGGSDEGVLNIMLSVIARRQHDADAALAHGRRGAELLPKSGAAHHVYSRAIAEQMRVGGMVAAMKNIKPWLEELRTAIRLQPDNVAARLEEIFFMGFVPKLLGGQPELAEERITELALYDEPGALGMRAFLLAHQEKPDEARAVCEAGIEEFPDDAGLRIAFGTLLENQAKSEQDQARRDRLRIEADEQLVFAVSSEDEENAYRALFQRAKIRIEGNYELKLAHELLDQYEERLPQGELLPTEARVHLRRGQAFQAESRLEQARASFERALELEPDLPEAEKALDALH